MGILKTIGKALKGDVGGAVLDIGSKFIGSAMSNKQSKKQSQQAFDLWQKQWNVQRGAALADYERQRKDYLEDLSQSAIRQKQALKAAGLNPALMSENSFSPAVANQQIRDSSASGIPVSDTAPQTFDTWTSAVHSAANLALTRATTEKEKSEAKGAQTAAERAQAEFENWRDTQRDLQNNIMLQQWYQSIADVIKTKQETAKSAEEQLTLQKQRDEIDAKIKQMIASTSAITFDVSKQRALLPGELRKQTAEIDKLLSSASLDRASASESSARSWLTSVQARFASMGIGIGNNFVDSALALFASGNGKQLLNSVGDGLKDLYTKVVPIAETGFDMGKNFAEGATDGFDKWTDKVWKATKYGAKYATENHPLYKYGYDIPKRGWRVYSDNVKQETTKSKRKGSK